MVFPCLFWKWVHICQLPSIPIKTRHWMEDPMKYAGIITLLIWILCTLYMFKAKIKTKHLIKVIFKLENTILYFSIAQMKYSFPKRGKKKKLFRNWTIVWLRLFSFLSWFTFLPVHDCQLFFFVNPMSHLESTPFIVSIKIASTLIKAICKCWTSFQKHNIN